MILLEYLLLGVAVMLLLSVVSSKASTQLGVPTLVLFLLIGMLAGSDGPGGIEFNNPWLAQYLGTVAMIFILFSGGLDTKWKEIKPVLWRGVVLSTVGVMLTAIIVGYAAYYVLDFSLLEAMLLAAIISSTDAAAVFSILRSKQISLKGDLRPLLELESGSNDPMAIFLTTSSDCIDHRGDCLPHRSDLHLRPADGPGSGIRLHYGPGHGHRRQSHSP